VHASLRWLDVYVEIDTFMGMSATAVPLVAQREPSSEQACLTAYQPHSQQPEIIGSASTLNANVHPL
jgi:hypothetical protein